MRVNCKRIRPPPPSPPPCLLPAIVRNSGLTAIFRFFFFAVSISLVFYSNTAYLQSSCGRPVSRFSSLFFFFFSDRARDKNTVLRYATRLDRRRARSDRHRCGSRVPFGPVPCSSEIFATICTRSLHTHDDDDDDDRFSENDLDPCDL